MSVRPEVERLCECALVAIRREDSLVVWFDERLGRDSLRAGVRALAGEAPELAFDFAGQARQLRVRPRDANAAVIEHAIRQLRGRVLVLEMS